MGFKEKMMDNMMGNMSAEEKKEMMDKMMENFFSTMTKEEKQDMMNNMMPKMMGQMMGSDSQGSGSGMMSMMSSMMGGKGSMMDMMNSMMGSKSEKEGSDNSSGPMDMCKKMMSTISQSSDIATFATPEIRQMFEEWVQQVDEEILNLVKDSNLISPEQVAEKLKISKNSAIYFLSRLAQKGKISININKAEG